ncbi:MAG: GNAT family N-acetyltransferase [Treponema sp.]|jgi:GNAT superfamily N-acetyltransferase|nr:GNAT family N-acetyltransferase [Treponema sp.]
MQFELTEALMDDILFSMEDQDGEFYIDALEGVVARWDDIAEGLPGPDGQDRYTDLPEWDSSDGFRLMGRFAAGFRNPLIREELTSALNRGRGVFRSFKNVLAHHPEAEKLWFAFKDREMKKEILDWYNALREEWGLEKIGWEPEETGDLVLEDFRFRELLPEDLPAALKLHRLCREGLEGAAEDPRLPGDVTLIAESGGGGYAGHISASREHAKLCVNILEVEPEYRGLGIGEALLVHLLESLDPGETSRVYLDLPASAEGFSRVLAREGFTPYMTRYRLDLKKPG